MLSPILIALLFFFATFSNLKAAPIDCPALLQSLLKPSRLSPFNILTRPNAPLSVILPVGLTSEERFVALESVALEKIMAAPGHTYIEDRELIRESAKNLEKLTELKKTKPIILNAVTHNDGTLVTLDLWTGHETLAAMMLSGADKIGSLSKADLRILINGKIESGEKWGHWIRASGADLDQLGANYSRVNGPGIDEGTLSVDGTTENFVLGSRTDMGGYLSTLYRKAPKIGVQFGTLDPYHEGHFGMVNSALKEFGHDEVIIVPGYVPAHKPNATPIFHRRNMIAKRVKNEFGMNLFTANSSDWLDGFGLSVFIERIRQTFGTTDVEIILGQDAFNAIIEQGLIHTEMREKYIVLARGNEVRPALTPLIHKKVRYVGESIPQGVSSTRVKANLKKGGHALTGDLHPKVLKYIKEKGLYETEKFKIPTGLEDNYFYKRVASGGVTILQAQVSALEILKNAELISTEFRKMASDKRSSITGITPDPDLLSNTSAEVPQHALEFALLTFKSPKFDRIFRPALINEILVSPYSGPSAIEALLPTVRGVQVANPSEIKQAVHVISELSKRTGNYVPRGQTHLGKYANELSNLLANSPIVSVSKIGEGNTNVTLLIEFEGGRKFVFKPRSGEKSFNDAENLNTTYIHFSRETDSFPLVEFWMGNEMWRGAGRTRVRTAKTTEVVLSVNGKNWGPGSLQEFQSGYTTLKDFIKKNPAQWENIKKSKEWKKSESDVRMIDFVMGNVDRFPNSVYQDGNLGNILVPLEMKTPSDIELILIDNGVGRPGHPGFDSSNLSRGVSAALRQALLEFDLNGYRNYQQNWLPVDGIEDAIQRIEKARSFLK